MTGLSSLHVSRLYESFRDTEVTFNSQVIIASGLLTSDVQFSFAEHRLPCVLYASSMKGARIIAELGGPMSESLEKAGSVGLLRLAFRTDPGEPVIDSLVPSRVESLTGYNPQKPQLQFASLEFVHRPPDILIGILGSFLEIRRNEIRRRDERIVLTPESMRRIGLVSKESCVAIGGSARRCILRDISFSGAKILMSTAGGTLEEKRVHLKLARCELTDVTVLDGAIVRTEDVEGRDDLVALSIRFSPEPPLSYKQKINAFFASRAE